MEPIAQALKPARSSSSDIGPAHHHSIGDASGRTKRRDHSSSKQMSKKTKFIEVVTGEKIEGDFDPTRAIKGTIIPPAGSAEVAGRSSEAPFMFECAWCGAINHAERRDSALYICFACGRPMRPALS
ncbi:MAG: hypothetical protein DME92_10285 [Verrucomicrobia bacterium]|nr:MAG: hypothetical protein DME92_10285 [Verrucomicrobiota bacterium]PYJ63022.1 MAG: hypothetical protein DME74_04705 [Verrucomicrobiota bacterium]